VARPVQQEVVEWDEYSGHLDAAEFVEVRARVSGLIVSAPFQAGAIVKQGDLLVELDVRPFQADLDSRIAEEARAAAQVKLAEVELKRITDMPPAAAVPIERERTEAALSEARAVLAGAGAAVESARLLVEWCRITAPITGRISKRYVDPGNLITGGSGTGTLLTTIASIDPIYCSIDADERAVLKYQRLARERKRVSARDAQIPFLMQLADETTFSHEGVVDFVDNRIDPMTGTIRGRGVLANPGGFLTPGFFARVRIPGSGLYQATLVPDSAVLTDQNQRVLYVVDSDDSVEVRPVKLGALFGELRSIESGIDLNDRVIINGLMQARPGAKVIPHESSISLDSLPPTPHETIPSDLQSPTAQQPPVPQGGKP
jgi:RND family efflux transporter MFP subunit